jgi:hypothetical protein
MKTIFLFVFLIPIIARSQEPLRPNLYFVMTGDWDTEHSNSQAVGGAFSFNIPVVKDIRIGAGAGIASFGEGTKPNYPVFLSFIRPSYHNKPYMFFIAQPGMVGYDNQVQVGRTVVKTTGGFYFFGGMGVGIPMGTIRPLIAAGYTRYNFSTNNVTSGISCLGLRVGFFVN